MREQASVRGRAFGSSEDQACSCSFADVSRTPHEMFQALTVQKPHSA